MVTRLPTANIPIPSDWVCKEALATMPDCELFPPSCQGAYMRQDLRWSHLWRIWCRSLMDAEWRLTNWVDCRVIGDQTILLLEQSILWWRYRSIGVHRAYRWHGTDVSSLCVWYVCSWQNSAMCPYCINTRQGSLASRLTGRLRRYQS